MNEEIQYSMTDEYPIHLGRASTGGTSTARILSFTRNHLEEDGNEDNVVAWTFTNVEEMSTLVKEELVRLPLRSLENSTCAPSSRGGGVNVQCAGKATR
jgi:hypothetical protein